MRDWWGPGVGLASAAVYALDPLSKHYVTILLSASSSPRVLVLAGVYAYTRAVRSRHARWWAATGALAGVAHARPRRLRLRRPARRSLAALLAARDDGCAAPRRRRGCAAAAARPLARLDEPRRSAAPSFANWGQGYNLLVAAHGEGFGRTPTEVSEDPAFIARPRAIRTGTRRRASSCSAIPRRTRATSRARTRRCASRAVELYRDRLGDEPLAGRSGRTSTARSFSGGARGLVPARRRRARRAASASTCSCSRWRSSASCSRYGAAARRAASSLFLLVYTRRDRDTPRRGAVRDAGARPLPRAHDVRCARAARAAAQRARRRAGTRRARTAPSPDFRPTS